MKNKFIILGGCLAMILSGCNKQADQKEIPITTSSEEALEVFLEARDNWELWEDTKAAKLFDQAIELDSNFAMAYFYRAISGGGANVFNKNIEKAASLANIASPGEQLLIKTAMNLLENKGNEMMILKDSLLKMYPGDKRVYYMFGSWNLNNDSEERIEFYKKALSLDENFFAVYPMLIDLYISDKDYDSARVYAERFIEKAPDSPEAYRRMGILESDLGNDQEALTLFKKSAEIEHTEYIETSIGESYILMGEYEQARASFRKNLDEKEQLNTVFNAYLNIAISYMYEKNEDAALQALDKISNLAEKEGVNSTVIASCFNRAQTCLMFKDYDKMSEYLNLAEADLEELYLPEREHNDFINLLIRFRGIEAIYAEDFETAAAYFNKFTERTKGNGISSDIKASNFDHGFLQYSKGNFEKAVDFYKEAFEGNLRDYYLALAYLGMDQLNQARPLLEKVAAERSVSMTNAFLHNWAKEELKNLENKEMAANT